MALVQVCAQATAESKHPGCPRVVSIDIAVLGELFIKQIYCALNESERHNPFLQEIIIQIPE